MYRFFAILSISLLLFTSCTKKTPQYGYVRLVFEHHWGDSIAHIDGITPYVNEADNIVTLNNVEYFISDLRISGSSEVIFAYPSIYYIRHDSTYSHLLLTQRLPAGNYQNIKFTFGIDSTKNKSNLFPNSPQKDMFWPESMGGGYHFLKIDGKWKHPDSPTDAGFGLHLGRLKNIRYDTIWTQSTATQEDSIDRIDSIPQQFLNYFSVSIPKNSFEVKHNEVTTVKIFVDLKQWMENPYTWDFDKMGGAIMSNEKAMDSLVKNGRNNVFK